jgi:nucleoside-diphosphate-sugar epimerase
MFKGVSMKILITGNMGYVGPSVMSRLRETYPDAEIVGLDSAFFAHCLTNAVVLPEFCIDKQIFMDVRDISQNFLEGFDVVVSLAAISNDIMGKIDESLTLDVNCYAGLKLAQLAKKAGVHSFVFASSCSVYGAGGEGAKNEEADLNPLTAYAKSKIQTEKGLELLADGKFKVTCLRFATACGMSDRLRLDLVINDFVACALASKKITVLSDGSPWRPLIHVKDMALAIDWAIGREILSGGPFLIVNTGSDVWNYQVKDLAQAVAKEISGTDIDINLNAPPDKRSYQVDFTYFKNLAPNHQPQVDLKTAVGELREGLEAMRFSNSDFRDSEFMRIKVLMGHRDAGRLTHDLRWITNKK